MAQHVNTQVRNAVKQRIAESVGDLAFMIGEFGGNVDETKLPAIMVRTPDAEVTRQAKPDKDQPALEKRVIVVEAVMILSGDAEGLDDTKDDLQLSIEEAVNADDDVGVGATQVQFTGHHDDVMDVEEGDRWFAVRMMSWLVTVWTRNGLPADVT